MQIENIIFKEDLFFYVNKAIIYSYGKNRLFLILLQILWVLDK